METKPSEVKVKDLSLREMETLLKKDVKKKPATDTRLRIPKSTPRKKVKDTPLIKEIKAELAKRKKTDKKPEKIDQRVAIFEKDKAKRRREASLLLPFVASELIRSTIKDQKKGVPQTPQEVNNILKPLGVRLANKKPTTSDVKFGQKLSKQLLCLIVTGKQ